MKKVFVLFWVLAFVCSSCIPIESADVKELKKEVAQLQNEVAELQRISGIEPEVGGSAELATTESTKSDKSSNSESASNKEQRAIDAINYCLKMYHPDLKCSNIRSVPKSDGTVDVIIDYKWYGEDEHTYYNVSVLPHNEYRVNNIQGLEGHFPYGDEFYIK